MNRKEIANETLQILSQGFYEKGGRRIDISAVHRRSVEQSRLILPQERPVLSAPPRGRETKTVFTLRNCSAVRAVIDLRAAGTEQIGVLNFASAKNPGGGFLNGAMAQEESLAASGGLYPTQTAHPEYYQRNRACKSMCYTDCAIYSPEVVFFRDDAFELLDQPVTASVLTLPAVNYGQVLSKGEDPERAKAVMRKRMRLSLLLFAAFGARNLILGAYGCGVFRNDPAEISLWWKELFCEAQFQNRFESVLFAVLDGSKGQDCWMAFRKQFDRSAAE